MGLMLVAGNDDALQQAAGPILRRTRAAVEGGSRQGLGVPAENRAPQGAGEPITAREEKTSDKKGPAQDICMEKPLPKFRNFRKLKK